jgi:hypothetical protein
MRSGSVWQSRAAQGKDGIGNSGVWVEQQITVPMVTWMEMGFVASCLLFVDDWSIDNNKGASGSSAGD